EVARDADVREPAVLDFEVDRDELAARNLVFATHVFATHVGVNRRRRRNLPSPRDVEGTHPEGWVPVAEDRGFEPLRAFTQPAFQASALGHYANPPRRSLRGRAQRRPIGMRGRVSAASGPGSRTRMRRRRSSSGRVTVVGWGARSTYG